MRYEVAINESEVVHASSKNHTSRTWLTSVRSDPQLYPVLLSCEQTKPHHKTLPLFIFKNPWYHGIYRTKKGNLRIV